jgi:hypothetical protein
LKEPWVVFYDSNGREICSFSVRGIMVGEISETKSLLAYDKGISASEIRAAVILR